MENSKKRKEREGKSREMYEKMFPELRKQREDKVRTLRCYVPIRVVPDNDLAARYSSK